VALGLALVMALLLSWAPGRVFPALLLLGLGVYLSILNQAPENPYFAQTLQAWEQGRFIRFNGLAQWLGWLWPYAVLGYALSLIWQHDAKN
jgi:O-antigen/teichoic acid export membrane protein